jgi:tetratricopeptide (TPR) repeat protein
MSLTLTASSVLEQAESLLKQSKTAESLAKFKILVEEGNLVSEAHYGIGLIRFSEKKFGDAGAAFKASLKIKPENANAVYYLGAIAEKDGEPDVARVYFENTLKLDANHFGAKAKLKARPLARTSETPVSPSQPMGSVAAGFYEKLHSDTDPVSKQAVALIESLKMTRKALFSAYLGQVAIPVLISVMLIFVIAPALINAARFCLTVGLGLLVGLRALKVYLTVKATKFTFD